MLTRERQFMKQAARSTLLERPVVSWGKRDLFGVVFVQSSVEQRQEDLVDVCLECRIGEVL